MKSIIVEDEFPAREELKYFIQNFSDIEIVSEFDNGLDVLKFVQNNKIDVIFLDINIPQLDGMLLAKTINQFVVKPKIVFITAYREYAVEAFELEIFDYILKPYSEEKIVSLLKKLENSSEVINKYSKVENKKSSVSLWKGDKLKVVDIKDICYCMANERETIVYTENDEYIVRSGIKEFEKKLNSSIFIKTHRSYIVNTREISEIIPWFNNTYKLKLKSREEEIPVSRSKIKEFKTFMNI